MVTENENKKIKLHSMFLIRRIIVVALVIVVIAAIAIIAKQSLDKASGRDAVAPTDDLQAVVSSQLDKNQAVANVKYDPSLSFDDFEVTIAEDELAPITDNLFKTVNGTDLLFDELSIGRVIQMNSDWVYYIDSDEEAIMDSFAKKSSAIDKLVKKSGKAVELSYNSISFGGVLTDGKDGYYVLTKEEYTIVTAKEFKPTIAVYVYKLISKGDTLLISDFEKLE